MMTDQRNSPLNDYREHSQRFKRIRRQIFWIRLGWVPVIIA
jgi:hypothetical protein